MEGNKKIFADSNYFIALFNAHDALHERAKKITREMEQIVFYISNFIFLETVTVLSQKCGRKTSREVGEHLLKNPLIKIVHFDEILQKETWRIFQEEPSKNISFADCSTVAVMDTEGISELLTFDTTDFKKLAKKHHFKLYGG